MLNEGKQDYAVWLSLVALESYITPVVHYTVATYIVFVREPGSRGQMKRLPESTRDVCADLWWPWGAHTIFVQAKIESQKV